MRRLLRAAAYAVLPGELVLMVCLSAGVRPPAPALVAAEAAVLLLLLAEVAVFLRLRRHGRTSREALEELVPRAVLRLIGHELRLMRSLALWVARRRDGVGPDDRAFGHARDGAALLLGFAFVCVIETIGMSYLLADVPVVHEIVLVVDLYTVAFILGLYAASVVRPHVLSADALRLRQAAHVDIRIPLDSIATVSYELLFSHDKKEEGVLDLAVGSQTSLTLRLSEPVTSVGLLGRERRVHTVRCHADDARALLAALTRARTARTPA
ncbi:hypothetical protein V1460_27685 [Streptomyces sp. SCSIO 30461]|uniref:hypothetical protein n=1 Tax=Streptomyces sp. SCSIO 30461 TaxID=3118085 RepID=UPI0030CE3EA4